jgi:hypothetical protein
LQVGVESEEVWMLGNGSRNDMLRQPRLARAYIGMEPSNKYTTYWHGKRLSVSPANAVILITPLVAFATRPILQLTPGAFTRLELPTLPPVTRIMENLDAALE